MADITDLMYASESEIGYGTQWLIGQDNGSPETFVAVAEVKSIKPGKISTGVVDVTHLRSPDRHREKKGTIRDSDVFTMRGNLNLDHGSQNNAGGDGFSPYGIIGIQRTVDERNMIVRLGIGSPYKEYPFRGIISGFEIGEITLDAPIEFIAEVTPLRDYSADLP